MKRYVIVENAGYDGETDITDFATYRDALRWLNAQYDEDEIDQLHVCIRRDVDGESEYV